MRRSKVLLLVVSLFFATAVIVGCSSDQRMVDVTLEGGTGRASITSPTKVDQSGDPDIATIEWSSPNYDYMIVDGERYLPTNESGNSTFEIPVLAYDEPYTVIADTTAMSVPHEIEYQLTFDSSSIH